MAQGAADLGVRGLQVVSTTEFEVRTADWLSLEDAKRRVLAAAVPTEAERVPVGEALGRALADDLRARATLPAWDNSAMDGYAVRGDDIAGASPAGPVRLRVVGVRRPGDAPGDELGAGEAVRTMTGAPVAPGADSVVRVEDTDAEDEAGVVRVLRNRDRGRNVRLAGQDMRLGTTVLSSGDAVRPGTMAVLAALGLEEVVTHRPPRVAVLATGDELRTPERYDEVISGLGVPDSNGPMVAAQVRAAGGIAEPLGIVADDPEALSDRLLLAANADVLVTLGGASMGEADLLKRVLDGLGFRLDFWRVRIRPGSPFSFGWLPREGREQPVFGLPGNPASAFVTFELFVRPFLLAMAGHRRWFRRTLRCVAGDDLAGPPGLTHFLRVRLDTEVWPPVATPVGPQGSGLVRTLARADGLAVVPEEADGIARGEPVDVMLLDDPPVAAEEGPAP